MRPLIAGNWKMNGLRRDGLDRARALAAWARATPPAAEIAIFPPATLLAEIRPALDLSPVALGAQDCAAADAGAHTGDIAAPMLADAGCRYVIVGHSERRHGHGESNGVVRAKAEAAHRAGLIAIVCVGETEAERSGGEAESIVGAQLESSLPPGATPENCVIAYEPVWAIGTGRSAGAEEIGAMHAGLRAITTRRWGAAGAAVRLLYGGSVDPANAGRLLGIPEVGGVLVGGASLRAEAFWAICEAGGAA